MSRRDFIQQIRIRARHHTPKAKRQSGIYIDPTRHARELIYLVNKAASLYDPINATLPYQEYLDTPYWRAIRLCKLHEAKQECQVCTSCRGLQVHHLNYTYRGREHMALHTLQLLCNVCHAKAHSAR